MEIDTLRLLNRVHAHGSFAAVARAYDLELSQVSRTVGKAESELGFRLFRRTTRQMVATPQGEAFLAAVTEIVDAYDRAREAAVDADAALRGVVRLTAPVAYAGARIVPRLGAFRQQFPGIEVELIVADNILDLHKNEIDIAIRHAPSIGGDLVCAKLHDTVYRVCASPSVKASLPHDITPDDIAGFEILRLDLPGFRDQWQWRETGTRRRGTVDVRGRLLFSSVVNQKDAVLAGLGPAMMADWIIERHLASGELIDLFPDHAFTVNNSEGAAWLVYPEKAYMPARVRAVIDFLRQT